MAEKKKKTESSVPKPLKPADGPETESKPVEDLPGIHTISPKDVEKHFGAESYSSSSRKAAKKSERQRNPDESEGKPSDMEPMPRE